ncbi:MAG TPA: putative glycolipid-binding domain-containing protein [Candidatus Binatia bacterium]|nr:putative glycolipid-binding domain-containing protein [Candidatus Binatia bacterium]
MDRQVMWQAWTGPGLELLRVTADAGGVRAESVAIGLSGGRAYTVRYALRCDAGWRVRTLEAWTLGDEHASLALSSDGSGRWTGPDGARRPALDGCFDVDFPSTAFTNTLPIRRLGMVPGWSEELSVVHVAVPDLAISVARQRYTCLTWGPDGGRYRFESPGTDFTAEITLDGDGLVVEYPRIARRVWAR